MLLHSGCRNIPWVGKSTKSKWFNHLCLNPHRWKLCLARAKKRLFWWKKGNTSKSYDTTVCSFSFVFLFDKAPTCEVFELPSLQNAVQHKSLSRHKTKFTNSSYVTIPSLFLSYRNTFLVTYATSSLFSLRIYTKAF